MKRFAAGMWIVAVVACLTFALAGCSESTVSPQPSAPAADSIPATTPTPAAAQEVQAATSEQQAPAKEPAAATPGTSVTVYVTKSGEKYHLGTCRYVKNKKIAISLQDAKSQGSTPCSVCNPPD